MSQVDKFSDEELVAYLDGEAEFAPVDAIKAALLTDESLANRLNKLKFDKEKNTLVEPYLPNHQIGIVHFAGKNNDQIRNDKNFISKVKATDGSLVEMKLRFNN